MPIQKLNPSTSIFLLIVFIIAILRLLTHYADHSSLLLSLTPFGAMALFGGAYFKGIIKPFLFMLLPLFISDVILCFTVYSNYREGLLYPGWFWVYASFGLMVLWGKLLLKERNITSAVLAIAAAVITHWILGNVGECLAENSDQEFLALFGSRLIAGIPYELKFLVGTTVYSVLMFRGIGLAQKKAGLLQANAQAS